MNSTILRLKFYVHNKLEKKSMYVKKFHVKKSVFLTMPARKKSFKRIVKKQSFEILIDFYELKGRE
jgi:hypothetical protein